MGEASKGVYQELGITRGNYVIMHYVYENPGISQAALAEKTHKDRNVITKMIDKLEKKEYVQRVRSEKDRRSFSLYLTPEGERIIHDYWPTFVKDEQECLNKLSKEEQKLFLDMLERLIEN